ncbi:MAG: tyrosine-type recombinase/integrase [Flavobacteriaceae bacterium]|nr:tyrosine-type recombinase/integrase [Flavobacteriaceae bacterium]
MLLSQASESYLNWCKYSRNLSPLTLDAYEIDLEQFSSMIGFKSDIHEIVKDSILDYQTFLFEKKLSASSVKRKMASLRAFFKWLEREEHLKANPFQKLQLDIKIPKSLPKNVPKEELWKLCRKAKEQANVSGPSSTATCIASRIDSSKKLNRLTAWLSVELMFITGIRVSELVNIRVHHLSLFNKKIKIQGKGSRERFVFIPDEEVCNLIGAYSIARKIASPECDNLLINSRGKPASTQFIRKLVKNTSDLAVLSNKVTPHMLRHSTACELLDAGVDIRYVQRLLGHSSISTTEIYTHVTDKVLQDKIAQANILERVKKSMHN